MSNPTPVRRELAPRGAQIAYRICPLCEATCGLELHLDGRAITLVRGDKDDVFSHGFICPKGSALNHLEADPDRVRVPQIRDRATNTWRDASWDEAFAYIETKLLPIVRDQGNDALAIYLGNPSVHSIGPQLYNRVLGQAARTRNVFTASTVDQMPKQVSAGLMFGTGLSVPVPDLDHTDYLLVLGANPFASNGSLMTAPDVPGRLRAIRARGGRIVVVDPRRSKTAEESDEWVSIVPGTDAHLLLAIAHVLYADGLVDVGEHLEQWLEGLDALREVVAPFTPEAVEPVCGIAADVIRRLAHELAAAPSAAVYGRIGTCVQQFGTVASWAVDVVNVLTGNLDRRGGAMFNLPAVGGANTGGTPGRGAACASVAAIHACAACLRCSASSRWCAWPRRSTRPARVRCARSSPSPATRSSPTPTRSGSTPRSRRSTSWSASTSTATRPRVTPM